MLGNKINKLVSKILNVVCSFINDVVYDYTIRYYVIDFK